MSRAPFRLFVAALIVSAVAGAKRASAQPSNLVPPGLDPAAGGGVNNNPALPPGYGYGPTGPAPPSMPARPATWPGGAGDPARIGPPQQAPGGPPPGMQPPGVQPQGPQPAGPPPPVKNPADPPYDPAAIMARVGSEVIQANEVLPTMHQYIEKRLAEHADVFNKLPPDVQKEQLTLLQRTAMQQIVDDYVKIKLLLSEIRSKVPADHLSKNEEKIRKEFNENRIKELMAQYKVPSIIELDSKLREQGSSLESQRRAFVDRYLAIGWLRQQVRDEKESTHEDMLTYYREHAADWETPARAQWEQISARFDRFKAREEAYRAIAQWGNEVLRGAPFAAVAKAHSQDPAADDGGKHDWTTKDSLRSARLDAAVFSLPEGQMSQVIEDEDGFHIVRVLKREEFRRAPFSEVQPEIKKRLASGSSEKSMMKYVEKLRETTPVWTRFDDGSIAGRPQTPAR